MTEMKVTAASLFQMEIKAPSLVEVLGEAKYKLGVEKWLEEKFARLVGTNSPMRIVMAAGVVGRLWTPLHPPRSAEEMLEISASRNGAHTWYLSLESSIRERLEWSAENSVAVLFDEIEALPLVPLRAKGKDALRVTAIGLMLRRDDLESFAFASNSAIVAKALAALDEIPNSSAQEEMWKYLKTIVSWESLSPLGISQHLGAVSWQEPGKWWGALA